ncbi:MAG TPA: twin-arginine translocase TatA/TatE family subunit [Chloroflexota bacterium]|nr:twin-arginine translocase TatA/TatE family subunit [Chloroflexota bacterium]
MFGIGPGEFMLVLVLALIVFGPAKLPELMASVGHAIREFQRASRELTEVFQETQQEFRSALDLDEQPTSAETEPEPVGYQVPAEETTVTPAETVAVAQQPEEFETAAAMVDPVEPFPVTAAPEPEPAAAVAETPKPKRARRKKAEADTPPEAEPAPAAEPAAAVEPGIVTEPAREPPAPLARPSRRRAAAPAGERAPGEAPVAELTTTMPTEAAEPTTTAAPATGVATTEPAANGVEPYPAPAEPTVNGAVPTPRRRRRATVAATRPEENP